jgi:hypothetical protein
MFLKPLHIVIYLNALIFECAEDHVKENWRSISATSFCYDEQRLPSYQRVEC